MRKLTHAAAAVLSLLAFAGCAPDTHGDLRDHVVVQPEGSGPRILLEGVGVGMSWDEVRERYGEGVMRGFYGPGTPIMLNGLTGDFGTELAVMVMFGDGDRAKEIVVTVRGNRIALSRVAARWREALSSLPSRDTGRYVSWGEGHSVATMMLEQPLLGTGELSVHLRG
jgi:hypothetical protein